MNVSFWLYHFNLQSLIFEIQVIYFCNSSLLKGFPCAGNIQSAFSSINSFHEFWNAFLFSIHIVTLLRLGIPFIAASPQKILLPVFKDMESAVCPGVNKIFPCNKFSMLSIFWGDSSIKRSTTVTPAKIPHGRHVHGAEKHI